tara:strand:- start:2049 stop:2873 length:825 start_codon:yes stop_codon:yes gene_type:complete
MVALGYFVGQETQARDVRDNSLDSLQDELATQSTELEGLRLEAERKLQAMTLSLAELQARMTRLDALGEHLTVMADLQDGEFDFSQPPAVGGPLAADFSVEYLAPDLTGELQHFAERLTEREQQLEILESLLTHRKLDDEAWVSGRPVEKGWVSSGFGVRTDPFSGKRSAHYGIDYAGKAGSNVIAVAGGVVTFAGNDSNGYGMLVEVSHGDGLLTRYAHNQSNLVEPGDLVRKGQAVALMGSSGRATGPHVHFEVYKHGRPVDPSSYVHRTRR